MTRASRRGLALRLATAVGFLALTLMLLPSKASALADNYRAFRFDLGGMYAYTHSTSGKGGALVLEPMFNITDQFSLGLRHEILICGQGSIGAGGTSIGVRVQNSFLLKGEYYLTPTGPIRPFVSLGAGMYYIAAVDASTNTDPNAGTTSSSSVLSGSFFGLAPQVGVELSVVRISFLYQAIVGAYAETKVSYRNGNPATSTRDSLNYLGIELSFRIGGGARETAAERPAPQPAMDPSQQPVE